jgi:HEAT repeat protein
MTGQLAGVLASEPMKRGVAALAWGGVMAFAISASAFVWPSAPAKIARALESGDVAERRQAAAMLGEMPEPVAAPLLLRALGDQDYDVRLRAAKSAIRLRSTAALDAVIPWLSDADVRIRLAACELIRYVPRGKAVLALGRVLGDPDASVRLAAASAMGASGDQEAVGPLLGHLDDPAPNVRAEVAEALARIGDPRAAVPLIGKIGDSAPEVRRAVARSLGELGDPRAASALILALRDAVSLVRVEAVGALGRLGSQEAVLAITPLLEDRSAPEVRVAAMAALGQIGSEAAIRALVRALGTEEPSAPLSPVRDALETSGARAVPILRQALEQYESPGISAGAALALGSMKAPGAGPAIVQAMRKGSLDPYSGLRALAKLGEPSTAPAVLEMLSDSNSMIRRQAVLAVTALLDPARHDGRAVEPLDAALADPRTTPEEKEQIARALGQTGAPRALGSLLPLVRGKALGLRLAAIDALGTLGPAGQDEVLLSVLGDDNAAVRLHAALALGSAGGEASVPKLLDRLTRSATEDRTAIGIALSGALSRSDDKSAEMVGTVVFESGGPVRDALIEGLGRAPGRAAGNLLAALAGREPDAADRRKIAEALAGHPEQSEVLSRLLSDPDPSVRAQAVWSSGALPAGPSAAASLARAMQLVSDPDLDVAANAVAASAMLARTTSSRDATAWLCRALGDFRSYVRANALAGLSLLGARCEKGAEERKLLVQDPSEAVRYAAARVVARAAPGAEKDDARALARCVSDDKSGMVAAACRAQPAPTGGTAPSLVLVIPDGRASPLASAAYSLARADGLIRSGLSDRRGAVFEPAAPKGDLRLLVPAPLAP